MVNRRLLLTASAAPLLAVPGLPKSALGQEAIPRLITMVVGIAAASVTDTVARLVARKMAQQLKTTVIVDNRPAAGQIIGINHLRSKPADGATLLFMAGSGLGQVPAVRTDLPYQPMRDFTFIARTAVSVGMIAASPSFKPSTLKDAIAYARERPGDVMYGSAGMGSAGHLQMEYVQRHAGISMTHVPFKSDTQLVGELAEGRISLAIMAAAAALPMLKAGRLKALAVTSRNPAPFLPGVPSLSEAGMESLAGLEPFTFFGLVGPQGLPSELVRVLNEAHNAGMRDPEVVQTLRGTLSSEPVVESPEAFRQFVAGELAKWGEIGKNLKLS